VLGAVEGAGGAAEGEVAEEELEGCEADLGVLEVWNKREGEGA
jgi:hypothetical protein